MKSSRLLRMLLLLQARSPRCASELARELEVSIRTIYRDADDLAAASVPIYALRGAHGGIALVDGYRRAIADLDEGELSGLFISGSDPLADLGFGASLRRARERLAGALSPKQRLVADKARERISVDQRRWGTGEAPTETLSLVRAAVWDERRIEIVYRDRYGARTSRRIDPLGLVAKSGIWYVVARDGTEYRTFRAERIVAAEPLAERFVRPEDFDLNAYWSQSTRTYEATIPSFSVTVRVRTDRLDEISRYWRTETTETRDDTSIVRFDFPGRDAALHQLVAWGDTVTVVAPGDLVPELVTRARAIIARYRRRPRPATGQTPRTRTRD